ncbi:MAG: hypothetical protein V3W44_04195 [Dehalococcoidales bacterium]
MCDKYDKVELPSPVWMTRKRRATIEVDACCVPVLEHLWANGVDTLYHCCGHSPTYEEPYIILAASCTVPAADVKTLVRQVDTRQWNIR